MATILGANTLSSGFDVANSVRFNDNDSPSMYKTPGSGGDQRTWTFSTWFKRGNLGSSQWILDAYDGSNDEFHIYVSSGNAIGIYTTGGGFGNNLSISTSNLVRDVGAWYHLVVRCDTTQGTASNRLRIYLNGTEATYGTYNNFTENGQGQVSESGTKHWIGRRNAGDYFDGYFAEMVLVDGSSLAPTSFGEFDSDSPKIWKPIDVSGLTFGTNGFYLDFEDSSNLGNDANGGTDFTEANLAAVDQTTDTPTNNFATMNPLDNYYAGSTFSEGNCRVVTGSSPITWNTSTFGLSSGKWYMEATIIDGGSGGSTLIGIADRVTVAAAQELGGLATTYAYLSSGNFRTGDSNTSNSVSATDGDIIGVALDLDSGQNTISYYKNNTLIVAAQNITAPVSGFYFIASGVWLDNDTGTTDHNFGNPVVAHSSAASDANGYGSFEFAPPSGYYAICTKNLAEFG